MATDQKPFEKPVIVNENISGFRCYGQTGIFYAFYMRFRRYTGTEWLESDRGPSVSVWCTGGINLDEWAQGIGLVDGDYVQLEIEVMAGGKVNASQCFSYKKGIHKFAHYNATGAVWDASIAYTGIEQTQPAVSVVSQS